MTVQFCNRFSINLCKYNYNTPYEVQQALDDDAGKLYFRMNFREAATVGFEEISNLPSRTTLNYLRQRITDKYVSHTKDTLETVTLDILDDTGILTTFSLFCSFAFTLADNVEPDRGYKRCRRSARDW